MTAPAGAPAAMPIRWLERTAIVANTLPDDFAPRVAMLRELVDAARAEGAAQAEHEHAALEKIARMVCSREMTGEPNPYGADCQCFSCTARKALKGEPFLDRGAARTEGASAESNPLNVERYDDWNRTDRVPEMTPCPEGEWVRWAHVWRYLAELASKRQQVEATEAPPQRISDNRQGQIDYMCQEIATVLGLPVSSPADTVGAVRDLMAGAERWKEAAARAEGAPGVRRVACNCFRTRPPADWHHEAACPANGVVDPRAVIYPDEVEARAEGSSAPEWERELRGMLAENPGDEIEQHEIVPAVHALQEKVDALLVEMQERGARHRDIIKAGQAANSEQAVHIDNQMRIISDLRAKLDAAEARAARYREALEQIAWKTTDGKASMWADAALKEQP